MARCSLSCRLRRPASIEVAGIEKEKLQKLALWIQQELGSLEHGEIHITLKIRDKHLALIENTKIVK
jgi:hypothetical protein